jgi:predicted AAA+ superfamily ATPase
MRYIQIMKTRVIGPKLKEFASLYPVITVTGPRQSGKTTLCRTLFPGKDYVNLEDTEQRWIAQTDPKGFLSRFAGDVVIDEVQRAPNLISAIQVAVDEQHRPGRFVLTGSQNLLLMKTISQSLAGRTALATLLPFSLGELYGKRPPALETVIWEGFYPPIHDQKLPPAHTLAYYFATYVERDLRDLLNVKDLGRFERFVRLCAGRTGQILNLSSLAVDAGIAVSTVQDWLSVLETCYIVRLLRPWAANINKRLIKAPKLYFLDTGLACYLMGIQTPEQMKTHPARGALFETFVLGEYWKRNANQMRLDTLHYFRDKTGNEIDLVEETEGKITLTEIKSGMTLADDWFGPIRYAKNALPDIEKCQLVYGGNTACSVNGIDVRGWKDLVHL